MERQSFPWVILFFSLLIGIGGGVYYAWFLNPVSYENVAPERLTTEAKEQYILIVSQAYLHTGDIGRAQARLEALEHPDIAQVVATQADSAFLRGDRPEEVQALTALAEALGAQPLAADVFSGSPAPTEGFVTPIPTPSPTASPTLTVTPFPTPTVFVPPPTPTPAGGGSFSLFERQVACVTNQPGEIEVVVQTATGEGVPGIEIIVRSDDAIDRLFTGLKPDIGLGFADFLTTPDTIYTVELAGLSDPVVNISSFACTTENGEVGSPFYRLIFLPSIDEEETP